MEGTTNQLPNVEQPHRKVSDRSSGNQKAMEARRRWELRKAFELLQSDPQLAGCLCLKDCKVAVVYIHVPLDPPHVKLARRFVDTYTHHPPLYPHEFIVVCNGSPPNDRTKDIFGPIQQTRFLEHDDSGWDIGAYQKAAQEVPCDLMVFLGGSAHFRRSGWLARMATVFIELGDAIYGSMGNTGVPTNGVYPHVRTTGFWMPPTLLNAYPVRVTRREMRYEFEHGKTCLTGWITKQNLKAWIVSWDSVYPLQLCNTIPNGFHQGDQSALLTRDRLTEPPFF